jgi:hypothetical protein
MEVWEESVVFTRLHPDEVDDDAAIPDEGQSTADD